MKRVTHEHQTYLDERARVQNGTCLQDYEQVLGENAIIWIDWMMDIYYRQERASKHYKNKLKRNRERWVYLLDNEGIDPSTYWAAFRQTRGQAKTLHNHATELLSIIYTSTRKAMERYHNRINVYAPEVRVAGNELGRLCGFSGWWHRPYDAVRARNVRERVAQLWFNYVYALLQLAHGVFNNISTQQLYINCTLVILHAKAFGKRWDTWANKKI